MNKISLNDLCLYAFSCLAITNIIQNIFKDIAGIFVVRVFFQIQNIPVIMQREFYKMNSKILFMQRKVYQLCERNSTTISSLYEMILIVNAVYDVPLVILAQIISFFRQFSVKVCGLAKYPELNPANVSCRPVYPRGVADSSGVLPVYQRCLSAAICCLPDVLNRFPNVAGELPEDVR